MNDFESQLATSNDPAKEAFWTAAYRQAFPGYVATLFNPDFNMAQRRGVDAVVLLADGRTLRVDNKERHQDFGDVLLEHKHIFKNGAFKGPGWIEKKALCDFIAYAILPTSVVYFFPWVPLQAAWMCNRERWLQGGRVYNPPPAPNRDYDTCNVAVSVEELQRCMWAATTVTF